MRQLVDPAIEARVRRALHEVAAATQLDHDSRLDLEYAIHVAERRRSWTLVLAIPVLVGALAAALLFFFAGAPRTTHRLADAPGDSRKTAAQLEWSGAVWRLTVFTGSEAGVGCAAVGGESGDAARWCGDDRRAPSLTVLPPEQGRDTRHLYFGVVDSHYVAVRAELVGGRTEEFQASPDPARPDGTRFTLFALRADDLEQLWLVDEAGQAVSWDNDVGASTAE
jgi:hypothetical protein